MENSAKIAYFGYGSLVNLATLRTPYISAHPARLKGWRRVWLSRPPVEGSFAPIDGLAFLSAEKDAAAQIDGMIVIDHASSLESLDEREALYDRLDLDQIDLEFLNDNPLDPETPTYIYRATPVDIGHPSPRILRSYLDAVLQGYFTHFGEDGLNRFHDSTRNTHFAIHEDAGKPLYPRSVKLDNNERAKIRSLYPLTDAGQA